MEVEEKWKIYNQVDVQKNYAQGATRKQSVEAILEQDMENEYDSESYNLYMEMYPFYPAPK